jgi:hypothetical protein
MRRRFNLVASAVFTYRRCDVIPEPVIIALVGVACLAVGFGISHLIQARRATSLLNRSKIEAGRVVEEAKKQADLSRRASEVDAKEIIEKRRRELDEEIKEKRSSLAGQVPRAPGRSDRPAGSRTQTPG